MVVGRIDELIIGSKGMLGSELLRVYPRAKGLNHAELDITDMAAVRKALEPMRPRLVINAAAFTDVDACEEDPERAFQVNAEGPGNLARVCEDIGSKFIHFSTDFVFDGQKTDYSEDDPTGPVNEYGKSKLSGERLTATGCHDHRIIRTSWLFGAPGRNFLSSIIRLSSQLETVSVVDDQFSKPTYVKDLAERVPLVQSMPPGIYHVSNEGRCSRYEFAAYLADNIVPRSSQDFEQKARRPSSSALRNTKLPPMRHWKEALDDYQMEMRT